MTQPVIWWNTSFFPRVQTGRATDKWLHESKKHKPMIPETKVMNRLPCCDCATRRSETAVFASLALAGIVSIGFAMAAVVKFVDGRDHVVAALSGKPGSVARKTPATDAPATFTNVTIIQSRRAPEAPAAPGKV